MCIFRADEQSGWIGACNTDVRCLLESPERECDVSNSTLVVGLRLTALVIGAMVVAMTWKAMSLLPWEADALIAVTASLAWAHKFER
jgi:hypothetical protein